MSTKPRVIVPHAFYQIRSEIVSDLVLFPDKKEEVYFRSRLKTLLEAADFKCISMTLHPNHYHLVVESSETTVSWFMRTFNSSIAKHLNKYYERKGKVFTKRFSSAILDPLDGLDEVACHVHLNPVRAKAYPPEKPQEWNRKYNDFLIQKKNSRDYEVIVEKVRDANMWGSRYPDPQVCVIGTLAFVKKTLKRHQHRLAKMRINRMRECGKLIDSLRESLEAMLSENCSESDTPKPQIEELLVFLGVFQMEISGAELGRHLGVSRSTVSRMISRKTGYPHKQAEIRKTIHTFRKFFQKAAVSVLF
ncbi:MAG: transposase [Chitinispirillaceae bacterium]